MGHSHDPGTENMGDEKLIAAVGVNILFTIVWGKQVTNKINMLQ